MIDPFLSFGAVIFLVSMRLLFLGSKGNWKAIPHVSLIAAITLIMLVGMRDLWPSSPMGVGPDATWPTAVLLILMALPPIGRLTELMLSRKGTPPTKR